MKNNDTYQQLLKGDIKMPSYMAVVPADTAVRFSVEQVEQALKSAPCFDLVSLVQERDEASKARFTLIAELLYGQSIYQVSLSAGAMDNIDFEEFDFGNQLSEHEMDSALLQPELLYCSTFFEDDSLSSFLFQLKVMDAIVPNASVVIDFMSYRLLSGEWLRLTAASQTPPSPDYLYSIHAMEEVVEGKPTYWLHTHGLHRCGSMELELLDIRNGTDELFDLLNLTAKLFIERIPPENEEFAVGYDGLGIKLCWRRWEDVVAQLPEGTPGGMRDRGDDDIHSDLSGVLLASQDGEVCSPEIYVRALQEDPLLYISNEETARMSRMAKERFARFSQAFARFGKELDWSFLVKLGYKTDTAVEENEREHLWFEVLGLTDTGLDAELLNEPYWISRMRKGDRATHSLDSLTDWIIYSPAAPAGSFTPDTIYQLYEEREVK